ncbi:MAG: isoprenyl transferase [Rhodospirillaceae bacterium]|nr:isoprenyl transferase [Rhodospirillaceae bacterium]
MEALTAHKAAPPPPVHVAIIMDGNGRWAKQRSLPRTAGHRRGVEAVRETVKGAVDLGIGYLTLYGFSSENWNRPRLEVDDLMGLLRFYLRSEIADLHRQGVRLRSIGDRARLAPDIVRLIEEAEERTRGNGTLNLTIALSYGGRDELVRAMRCLAAEVAAGKLAADAIDETAIERHLFTAGLPNPDLVIRTSGEKRISNFLLWQSAYAEMVFDDCLWPDFGRENLRRAVEEYLRRERRYGTAVG